MDANKIYRLIDKLLEKTKDGTLRWEFTGTPDTFQVALPYSSIRVLKKKSSENLIELYNEEGILIEQFPPIINNELFDYRPDTHQILASLFEMARRQALHVDQEIDKILNTLENGFHS